jgi:O-antigen ligase
MTDASRINIVTIIFAGIINYRETSYENNYLIYLIIGGIIVPFMFFDLYRQGLKYKNSILIAMIIFLLANILSMVNITKETLAYGLSGIAQNAAFCLLFLYIWNIRKKEDYKFIGKSATYLSIAISIQVLIFLLTYEGEVLNKNIFLGWSASNTLAMIYLLLIPMTIYLYIENQKRIFLLPILIIDIAVIILTFCKGAYLTLAILFIPMVFYMRKFVKDRRRFTRNLLVMAGMMVLFLAIVFSVTSIREGFVNYFSQMAERGWFNDKARIEILKYGASVFKKFPLFGSGSFTSTPYLVFNGYKPSLKHYHNIIIQNLATMGIFGLLAFGNYLIQIFRKAKPNHFYNISVLFAVLSMLIHGMVDSTWHNPIIFIIMTIYLTCLVDKKEII